MRKKENFIGKGFVSLFLSLFYSAFVFKLKAIFSCFISFFLYFFYYSFLPCFIPVILSSFIYFLYFSHIFPQHCFINFIPCALFILYFVLSSIPLFFFPFCYLRIIITFLILYLLLMWIILQTESRVKSPPQGHELICIS